MKVDIVKFELSISEKTSGWHKDAEKRILKHNNMQAKIKEFRIGNYLLLDNEIVKIEEIRNSLQMLEVGTIDKFNNHDEVDLDYRGLNYIQLTEEKLLKLGFNKINYFKWSKNEYELETDFFANEFDFYRGNSYLTAIYYVHQLQNLFFSLVGEELVFSSTEP